MESVTETNQDVEKPLKFVDLFCGIGGFRIALEAVAMERNLSSICVFSSDIDKECQNTYAANFNEQPYGDITEVEAEDVPDHDLLLAGFPCQPFSIIGNKKGFEDARGALFFDIARILERKRPQLFILENVKLLTSHDKGRTLARIMEILNNLGYHAEYRVLNALDFGLPQKRERVWIVGLKDFNWMDWPEGGVPMKPLDAILERDAPRRFFASDYIREKRRAITSRHRETTIWHENKSGNISALPYSCALRSGASYNYLLVNGERRLTPREMLRLQGFPDSFKIVCNDSQCRKQAGNSLPVNVAKAVIRKAFEAQDWGSCSDEETRKMIQTRLFKNNDKKTKIKNSGVLSGSVSC